MKVKFTKQKLPTGIFIYEDYVMTLVWIGDPTAFVKNQVLKDPHFIKKIIKKGRKHFEVLLQFTRTIESPKVIDAKPLAIIFATYCQLLPTTKVNWEFYKNS